MHKKIERLLDRKHFLLTRGREYVEIEGVKWATCNIGAEKPTDLGLFFSWADTNGYTLEELKKGKHRYSWDNYKYGMDNRSKYNGIDRKKVLDLSDDAAHYHWGGLWRMPTYEECEKLFSSCDKELVKNYQGTDTNGLLLTYQKDKTKQIFFPSFGYVVNNSYQNFDDNYYYGDYWLSDIKPDTMDPTMLGFSGEIRYWCEPCMAYYGFQVRGVIG